MADGYPPTTVLSNSSKPISLLDAQELISSYLKSSETNPYLHPDAILQPAGPTFSTQGGPQGGLVLQQLRRVEAGLRGEILKPDPKLREIEGDDARLDGLIADTEAQLGDQESAPAKRKGGLKRKAQDVDEGSDVIAGSQTFIDGKADPEVVAAQLIESDEEVNVAKGAETGELGDRSNFVEDAGELPEVLSVPKSKASRDAKKAEKRAKRLKERQEGGGQRVKDAGGEAEPVSSGIGEASVEKKRTDKKEKRTKRQSDGGE